MTHSWSRKPPRLKTAWPTQMMKAKSMVPKRMPRTRSMRNPPTTGSTTLGQEYQEYRLANWAVVMFIDCLMSVCSAPGRGWSRDGLRWY